jgi:hypothetical protein
MEDSGIPNAPWLIGKCDRKKGSYRPRITAYVLLAQGSAHCGFRHRAASDILLGAL